MKNFQVLSVEWIEIFIFRLVIEKIIRYISLFDWLEVTHDILIFLHCYPLLLSWRLVNIAQILSSIDLKRRQCLKMFKWGKILSLWMQMVTTLVFKVWHLNFPFLEWKQTLIFNLKFSIFSGCKSYQEGYLRYQIAIPNKYI